MSFLCILLLSSSHEHIVLSLTAHHAAIIKLLFFLLNDISLQLIAATISSESKRLHKLIHDLLLIVPPIMHVSIGTLQCEIIILVLIYHHFRVYLFF